MNGQGYLIPANSKKSSLILGLFTEADAWIFGGGVGLTLLLLLVIHADTFWGMAVTLIPGLVAAFLVFPVPNYHNILQLLINIYTFYFVRQRTYTWKGWCYKDGRNK